jgi:hypothetical protein
VGWWLTRAAALTLGQGVFWVLVGLAFVVLGLVSRWLVSRLAACGLRDAEIVPLGFGLLVLVAILFVQAGILGRTTRRSRVLAQEIALLKHADDPASTKAKEHRRGLQAGGPGSDS